MKSIKQKFKKGAASFYIVAFSTLILLIVATGFAAIIISEITRSQNDDLSQSAYDSALAGIEDAKLAIYDYQNCKAGEADEGGNGARCDEIIKQIEEVGNKKAETDEDVEAQCNMVATILGRDSRGDGVLIQETTEGNNNMQQAYTCVQVQNNLWDYEANLSPSVQTKVVDVYFTDLAADKIKWVKLSWFNVENANGEEYNYGNFSSSSSRVQFPKLGTAVPPTPPTISLAVVQTAKEFNFEDFDVSSGDRTDRGMVYLVPTEGVKNGESGPSEEAKTYATTTWDDEHKTNVLGRGPSGENALANSNNKAKKNLPYAVNCPKDATDSYYACSAMIYIPDPVSGASDPEKKKRNDDTFRFVVSLPYGTPSTDFKLEFYCEGGEGGDCYKDRETTLDVTEANGRANLRDVQIKIDSTGRANDLYRRVVARLEASADNSNLSVMGPLEILDGLSSGASLEKTDPVTCEYNFGRTCP